MTAPGPVLSQPAATDPADVARARVAEALDRPERALRVLEQTPVELAFVEGRYVRYTVRDLATGETLDVTIDLDDNAPVPLEELMRRDREAAAVIAGKLSPEFLDLLLAHPRLPALRVRLVFNVDAVREPGQAPPMDWLEPELRDRFQGALDAERQRLGIATDLTVRPDWPVLKTTLSAQEVIRLAQSNLVAAIELTAEPDILDERAVTPNTPAAPSS